MTFSIKLRFCPVIVMALPSLASVIDKASNIGSDFVGLKTSSLSIYLEPSSSK